MRRAAIDEGAKPGQTRTEFAELREACKRFRLLEQGNEVPRWAAGYLLQANLLGKGWYPLVTELAAAGIPVTVTCHEISRGWRRAPAQGSL